MADKKVEVKKKQLVKELKISIKSYFMKKEIEKYEWHPRTVYASKHTTEQQSSFKEWEKLFKKY